MPLIEKFKSDLAQGKIKTRLNPYGNDRFDGGNSGQPYIKKPIPDNVNTLGVFSNDVILRGGLLTRRRSLEDVDRLSQMLVDPKSPKGLIFIAKQKLLYSTSPITQAISAGGRFIKGLITPIIIPTQAGVVAFGGHLKTQTSGSLVLKTYSEAVKYNQKDTENRLATLYSLNKDNTSVNSTLKNTSITLSNKINVMSYPGGPGANLGLGKTFIKYASDEQRTGKQNIYFNTNENWFYGKNKEDVENLLFPLLSPRPVFSHTRTDITEAYFLDGDGNSLLNNFKNQSGVSKTYLRLLDLKDIPTTKFTGSFYDGLGQKENNVIYANNSFTYNQQDIIQTENNVDKLNGSPKIQDFRAKLRNSIQPEKKAAIKNGSLTKAPAYDSDKAYERRVNIGGKDGKGPGYFGSNKDLSSYSIGSGVGPIDQINALTNLDTTSANDLVKFRITFINNSPTGPLTHLHFRAFLDSMSDSYNATWNNFNFLGRNELFYTYGGYSRQMSLSWTVAAQSKEELIPMYKKLNYLASSLTGDYSESGYMRGNLVKLTVGGYIYDQPGIITSLTYDVPEESPWEIGINDNGKNDPTVKELPHIMKVTGFNFIPIQTFIPQMQNGINDVRRYISLSNGKNNYDDKTSDFNGFTNFNKTNGEDFENILPPLLPRPQEPPLESPF